MRLVTIFLMAIALASIAMSISGGKALATGASRSRFLASNNPKKCYVDPSICQSPGSGGPHCCGDQCVDLDTDVLNCGKCGKVCKFTDACCSGKCVDLSFDKGNCGSCGNNCVNGVKCFYGLCNYA